jgi:integrase
LRQSKQLKNDRRKITILTDGEVKELFPKNYKSVWCDKEIAYAVNRLASLTGMRIGEILWLRGEYVFEKHIYICGQYGKKAICRIRKQKKNRGAFFRCNALDQAVREEITGRFGGRVFLSLTEGEGAN